MHWSLSFTSSYISFINICYCDLSILEVQNNYLMDTLNLGYILFKVIRIGKKILI